MAPIGPYLYARSQSEGIKLDPWQPYRLGNVRWRACPVVRLTPKRVYFAPLGGTHVVYIPRAELDARGRIDFERWDSKARCDVLFANPQDVIDADAADYAARLTLWEGAREHRAPQFADALAYFGLSPYCSPEDVLPAYQRKQAELEAQDDATGYDNVRQGLGKHWKHLHAMGDIVAWYVEPRPEHEPLDLPGLEVARGAA